jgi:hypothetical protein
MLPRTPSTSVPRILNEWKVKTNAAWNVETENATVTTALVVTINIALTNVATANFATANTVDMSSATTNVAGSLSLPIRFEWYRPRIFHPHQSDATIGTRVLVLWLDDSFFEDAPLLRLPLFLKPLIVAADPGTNSSNPVVRLIGPRRSSTLRALLPDEFTKPGYMPLAIANADLWKAATNTLGRIALYSATANAMDEVLVTNATRNSREVVRQKLVANGFREVHFFNGTDAQLADEILQELKLRGADLSNPQNHLVLISEWDTFYGRMLSLTYGATLAMWQTRSQTGVSSITRAEFVEKYRSGKWGLPANFHPFVFQRGLDGRTVGGDGETGQDKSGKAGRARFKPESIEDLVHWTPDANKAEGPGQFDYLSRTGEWMESLRAQIELRDGGKIKAVGIMGSDVYDILLILQALRHRFPDVLFFTTDLDARFWHPSEREWARNLIVASSYGLRLHPDLQTDVAPFRDSSQSAQFAATLAALGHETLTNFTYGPPRRFEIGHRTVVDLSITNNLLPSSANLAGNSWHGPWLHPFTRSEDRAANPDYKWKQTPALSLAVFFLAAALVGFFYWSPFRRRGYDDCGYFSRSLPFSDPDVGGPDGAEMFLQQIFAGRGVSQQDSLCKWMADEMERHNTQAAILFPPVPYSEQTDSDADSPATNQAMGSIREYFTLLISKGRKETVASTKKNAITKARRMQAQRADIFLALLNEMLHHKTGVDEKTLLESKLVSQSLVNQARPWKKALPWWKGRKRREQRGRTRRFLDDFLHRLTLNSHKPTPLTLVVAQDARLASGKLFGVGNHYLRFFVPLALLFIGVAIAMGLAMWNDTFNQANGEPFSLTSGTSAWPNVILRALSTVLAIAFIFLLIQQLRSMFYSLSRHYRIPLQAPGIIPTSRGICASQLWKEFHDEGHLGWRLLRAGVPCLVYYAFGFTILHLFGFPFQPLRGHAVAVWAEIFRHPFVLSFLLLSFLTIDAALRCRRFINELSAAPTDYPETTRAYFKGRRGDVGDEYLDEWIDTNLIADLTERVGGLLWFPSIVFLLMLASRNQWTDYWPTSNGLLIILVLNFVIAIASVVILQRTARKAKSQAEESLYAKVKKAQAAIAPTPQDNDAAQAEKLLDEIRNLRRGAFVGFWENPAVGALFLAPGGTAILALLQYLATR